MGVEPVPIREWRWLVPEWEWLGNLSRINDLPLSPEGMVPFWECSEAARSKAFLHHPAGWRSGISELRVFSHFGPGRVYRADNNILL